jgi:hypothetical protein
MRLIFVSKIELSVSAGYALNMFLRTNVPQVMELTAIARPRPEHDFDGLVGIWRCSFDYEAKRKSKYHEKGDVYQKDLI